MGKYNTATGEATCIYCEVGRFGKQRVTAPQGYVPSVNVEEATGNKATTMRVCGNCPAGTFPPWIHCLMKCVNLHFLAR
jgi:hypothetical protein